MKIGINNVDQALYQKLKSKLALENKTIVSWFNEAIQEYLIKKEKNG